MVATIAFALELGNLIRGAYPPGQFVRGWRGGWSTSWQCVQIKFLFCWITGNHDMCARNIMERAGVRNEAARDMISAVILSRVSLKILPKRENNLNLCLEDVGINMPF
jgi:hypothetical protein